MSDSLAFHRKYRPRVMRQYKGNDKVVSSIMAALRSEIKPQVILMEGSAGCGKTSMARLLVGEYSCENRDPIHGACGECYSCKAVQEYIETGNEGVLMNIREIDVTDSNKKQDIDELLEDASIPSFDGSWKIYILDECHKLSDSAQSRLLKSLEEPAEKVLMILCTTNPEKLLGTIISRCEYRYHVKKPDRATLGGMLGDVCKNEGVEYDSRGLSLICAKSDFIPRNSLIALQQVITERRKAMYDDVVSVLNIVVDKFFFDFFSILKEKKIDVNRYVCFIGKLKSEMDLKIFLDNLIDFTTRGLYVTNDVVVEALDRSEVNQYKKLFKEFEPEFVANLLTLLLGMKGSKDLEARLLLMGYSGVVGRFNNNTNYSNKIDTVDVNSSNMTAEKERFVGSKNFNEAKEVTQEEKEAVISQATATMDMSDVLNIFKGSVIV